MKKTYLLSLLFYFLLWGGVHAQTQSLSATTDVISTPFITRWDLNAGTGTGATQLSFRVVASGTVSYTWTTIPAGTSGSGTFTNGTATITGLPAGARIELSIAPTNFQSINIHNNTPPPSLSDASRLTEIKQWGTVAWTSMSKAFLNCGGMRLTATDVPNLAGVTNMEFMFAYCVSFNEALPEGFNTSAVTNMNNMFNSCATYNKALPSTFDTRNVTNMTAMFASCSAYNQPLPSSFNTSAVTNMGFMFSACRVYNQPLPSSFNTEKVTNMTNMFSGCSAYNEPLPSSFNTSAVTTMLGMFNACSVYNQALPSSFNTEKVTDMSSMFRYCYAYNQALPISFNTVAVTNMSNMFGNCFAYNQPFPSNFTTAAVTDMSAMFGDCNAFNQPLNSWDIRNVTSMIAMFTRARAFNQSLAAWGTQLNATVNLGSFLDDCGMNTANYDATLTGFNAGTVTGRTMGARGLRYCASATDRANLVKTTANGGKGWTITGDYLGTPTITCPANISVSSTAGLCGAVVNFTTPVGLDCAGPTLTALQTSGLPSGLTFPIGTTTNQYRVTAADYQTATCSFTVTVIDGNHPPTPNCPANISENSTGGGKVITFPGPYPECSGETITQTAGLPSGSTFPLGTTTNAYRVQAANGQTATCSFTVTVTCNTTLTAGAVTSPITYNGTEGSIAFTTNLPNGSYTLNYKKNSGAQSATVTVSGGAFTLSGLGHGAYSDFSITNAGCTASDATTKTLTNPIRPFITTWKTTTGTIKIPTFNTYTYNYSVKWTNLSTNATNTATVTSNTGYTITGLTDDVYKVEITGVFPAIIMLASASDAPKLLTIEQWGEQVWKNMAYAFYGCPNLTYNATDAPNLSQVTDMSGMFNQCSAFNGNIDNWNVSKVTNMSRLFYGARFFNQPLNSWNTANVTNMNGLFAGANAFNQPLNSWNTANVTDMAGMFYDASSFNQVLNSWNTANVTDMGSMFSGASAFNQALNGWNTAKVTVMVNMFSGASAFNQALTNWNTANVTDMSDMFSNASTFNQPLNSWNTANVTNMIRMFAGASSFNQPLNSWSTSKVTNMGEMFRNASSFNQSLASFQLNAGLNMGEMLDNSGLNIANYDATLIGWASQSATGRSLGAAGLNYCAGEAARTTLTTTKSWDITGDSKLCTPTGVSVSVASICAGASIQLSANCATGLTLQWYTQATGGSSIGSTSPLSQSPTTTTTYYASCSNGSRESERISTGQVTVYALPVVYSVTGGGVYCTGGTGVMVGLSSSETGINYQLKRGSENVGIAVAGNGNPLTFGNQTTAGTYSVVATRVLGSCVSNMTGSVSVVILTKPSITLTVQSQLFSEGNSQTLCDLDANPVNGLQFNVTTACAVGNPVWRVQVGNGAWSDWSATAPASQLSNNQPHRYQAACDANCPITYTTPISVTINYRAATPQNVSMVADGSTVVAGGGRSICDQAGNALIFNATCGAGERLLYSVDGSVYVPTLPTQIVDGQYHNYRVRCQKVDGTVSCVENESGLMRLKITSIAAAPVANLSATSGCGTPSSFSGTTNCGSLTTVWYNATTNAALPNLPSITPNETTSYYARCQNEEGCQSEKSNTVTFTLTPVSVAPVVSVSSDLVCTGTSVTVSTSCPVGASVLWNTGVSGNSFQVAFSNVTTQGYSAKCVFANGCQSSVSATKTVRWKGFELTIINIGQSKSAIKTNDRAAWASQFVTADAGPNLDNSTESSPTLFYSENANKTGPRYWTIHADACALGTAGSMTFDMLATPETGVVRSFNTHENNAPYFMYANRDGYTELYAQNHPAYGFFLDNGSGVNVYDEGLPKGLYKLAVRYWDQKGWGSIYPSTRKPQGSVLAYQEYWFRIQSKDGVGTGAARQSSVGSLQFTVKGQFAEVAPNPVATVLRLNVSDAKGQQVKTILMDASGRELLSHSFTPESNQHQEEFNVSEMANGMYFLKVNAADKQATLKVIKVE